MIGGSDDNADAYERKQVYLEVLKENGIPFEDRYYIEGRLSRSEYKTFQTFIDRNPDIEAVFCVNDDSIIENYTTMRKKRLHFLKNRTIIDSILC